MSKLIQATFFPGDYESITQRPPILIIDDDSGFSGAAKFILEKKAAISCVNRTTTRQSSSSPQSISKEGVAMSSQVAPENLTTAQSPHAEADRSFYYSFNVTIGWPWSAAGHACHRQ
jgi:hypothetical protein